MDTSDKSDNSVENNFIETDKHYSKIRDLRYLFKETLLRKKLKSVAGSKNVGKRKT